LREPLLLCFWFFAIAAAVAKPVDATVAPLIATLTKLVPRPNDKVRHVSGSVEPAFQAATSAFVPRRFPAWICPLESGHGRLKSGSTN
jgi:hypothetical protein